MGLDITAYSRLKHVGKHEKDVALNEGEPGGLDDFCYYEDHVHAFAYSDFPQSFRGIPILGTRTFRDGSGAVEGGCFERTAETQEHRFRAGSYSGYGVWRANLAAQFNPERDPEKPFFELIFFADNEGCIGPEAAADLLADFREHAGRYSPGERYAEWHRRSYDDWMRAFELAADGGLVHFH